MKKIRLLMILSALVGGVFLRPPPVRAVVKESGDLHIEHDDPLFPASEVWYPGKSMTKGILIKNLNSSLARTAGFQAVLSEDSPLADVLVITMRYGVQTLWGPGSLRDLLNDGEVILTSIGPGGSVTYDLTASMDAALGNDYQNQRTVADFSFGFTPLPTSAPSGGGGGGASSPPTCNAIAPEAVQGLTASSGGVGEVILSWLPASGTVTHYLVAYGSSPGNYVYGNPDVGNVTSYTVSGLSSGVVYYFVVKGVNDCAPGPFSDETSATAGGAAGAAVATGPATGFSVLGEKKEAAAGGELGGGVSTEAGETAGVFTVKKGCFWWLILSILATLLSYFNLKRIKKKKRKHLLIPLFWAIAAFAGDKLAHHWFLASKFCHLMWLWAAISFLIGVFIWRRQRS